MADSTLTAAWIAAGAGALGALFGAVGGLGGTVLANRHQRVLAQQNYHRAERREVHRAYLSSALDLWSKHVQMHLNNEPVDDFVMDPLFDELHGVWLVAGEASGDKATLVWQELALIATRSARGNTDRARAAMVAYVNAVRAELGLPPIPADEWWHRAEVAVS